MIDTRLIVTASAAVVLGLAVAVPAAIADSHGTITRKAPQDAPIYQTLPKTDTPPECVSARIVDNSGNGPTMWVRWCGTGAGGESPMDATTYVIVDGGPLTPKACTKASPCVVQWPAAPPS